MSALKTFRTLTGAARKAAMRDYLTSAHGVVFGIDPHAVPSSHMQALHDMAKAVCWRKSISSPCSLGHAFYRYLSRDVEPSRAAPIVRKAAVRQSIQFGKGY